MTRFFLLRGVSAGALTFAILSPALATHQLPTIDVNGQRHAASQAPSRPAGPPATSTPAPGPVVAAPAPSAVVSRWAATLPDGRPAFVQKWQLPNTVASVTRPQIERRINIIDTEDAVKYMPSLFVRKRNNGDTQAVLATRTWGVNSSARSLVYADDLLLTALIGNDNTIGAPRWGLVAPEEIERVDFLYGPYSAQYSGNSMGGVLKITTRMPEKLEVSIKDTLAVQDFSLYGTSKGLVNNVVSAFMGDRMGDFSWTISGNWQRGSQQPLTYATLPQGAFTTAGLQNIYPNPNAFFATTKFGVPATVVGSLGNLDNDQVNGKVKLAYDFTNTIRGTYTLGFWSNDGTSYPENYLVAGYGAQFGNFYNRKTNFYGLQNATLQSFGGGFYRVQEKMLVNAAAVRSNTGGLIDWEVSASNFSYLQSNQRAPYSGAQPYGGWTQTGRNTVYTGTYWTLLDLKGIVRPEGALIGHDISFGLHGDQFHLNNPTWVTTNWTQGTASAYGVAATIGDGTTRTRALWAQDAWKINDAFKFTVGIRGENWIASNGYNQQLGSFDSMGIPAVKQPRSSLPVFQPVLYSTRWSPKGSLQWTPDALWTVTGSVGMANRFPTARELYNLTTAVGNGPAANPNPNLRPEVALTKELSVERKIGGNGTARVSLFDEEVRDAIISQTLYVPATTFLTSGNVNIQRIRNSGVEAAVSREDVYIKGLELTGSVTFVNSRIIANPSWQPALGNNLDNWCYSVVGKNVPYVPKWRWTGVATYRPDDKWAFTVAARWQDRMWSTLSNNDIAHGVYGAFDRFFIVDAKINYKYNPRWSFDFGVDNIGNYKYFLFHPFPQRTFFVAAKYDYGADKHPERGVLYLDGDVGLPEVSSWFQPVAMNWD